MLANAGTVENLFAMLFVLALVGPAVAVAIAFAATMWPSSAGHSVTSLWHRARWGHV